MNIGPGGVNVSAPRVQAPRVQPPRMQAPRVKQPRVPTTPKGFIQAFKKMKLPSRGGGADKAAEGPVAPQPVETWQWQKVGEGGGKGKAVFLLFLLLLFAGAGAAAGWWFFVREDEGTPLAAAAASGGTPKQFVTKLEPLIVRSARDRARVSRAITQIGACSIGAGPAAEQISATIRGRQTVLRQVKRVPRPTAQARNAARQLEGSLTLSAAAARDYALWIASFGGGCPLRAGPEYAKAQATNRRAQNAKRAFTRLYNPIARRVGGRTWKSTQF